MGGWGRGKERAVPAPSGLPYYCHGPIPLAQKRKANGTRPEFHFPPRALVGATSGGKDKLAANHTHRPSLLPNPLRMQVICFAIYLRTAQTMLCRLRPPSQQSTISRTRAATCLRSSPDTCRQFDLFTPSLLSYYARHKTARWGLKRQRTAGLRPACPQAATAFTRSRTFGLLWLACRPPKFRP